MSQKYNFILLDAQNSGAKKLTPLNLKLRLTAVNYFRKKKTSVTKCSTGS